LPEAWSRSYASHDANLQLGLWVVIGLFTFTSLEVFLSAKLSEGSDKNNYVTGYLNVFANAIDNFSHGLAVAASFLIGIKIGIITTFAIVLHEVPHEFGDFAILLKSGFSKWEAAKAQMSTASIGLLGAAVALTAGSADMIDNNTGWILRVIIPFSAGGFLHISMVSILPDLVREDNPRESMKQIIAVASGIAVMAFVNCFFH
jgi:zinc transporter 13